MAFQIQYVSDIHLEFHDKHNLGKIQPDMFVKPGGAKYLALIGDIGVPERAATPVFLEWCSKNWEKVFWVPGNHEYYNNKTNQPLTIQEKDAFMEKLVDGLPNVHLLNRNTVDVDDFRIVGCTLWSYIPPEKDAEAITYMNDSRSILAEPNINARPHYFREWHLKDVEWLKMVVDKATIENKQLVILTHFLPSYRLIHPRYEGHPLNCGFATNLEHLIRSPVRAWLCGHSHSANEMKINDVYCALNPYGYPDENRGKTNRCKVFSYDALTCEKPCDPCEKLGDELPCDSYDFV